MEDARLAVETGVDGVDVVIGTSSILREFSHGKDMASITKSAIEVINFVKRYVYLVIHKFTFSAYSSSKGLEVRFSSEDSFRSDFVDLLSLYKAVDQAGVNRVGIADTVGCASPRTVYDLVRTLRGVISNKTDIETHFHNDTGCAIANAFCALEAGATRKLI
jgi:homocitrate synthase